MKDNPYERIMKSFEIIPNLQREREKARAYVLLSLGFASCYNCEYFSNCCLEGCVFGNFPPISEVPL